MKRNLALITGLVMILGGLSSCYRYVGSRHYPGVPRLGRTHPDYVELLRKEPRRDHIPLGEVWMKPEPDMSRYFVEYKLKEKAAKMGADALIITVDEYFGGRVASRRRRQGRIVYQERLIVGVAISFR